jgi:phosphotransferase system enzyme I (PtsI)
MIKMVVDAGRANGIWTGICGEMAGDVLLTPLLIGLGVDELSVTSAVVPRVKKAIQSLDAAQCEALVQQVLGMEDSAAIADLSLTMARERYADIAD